MKSKIVFAEFASSTDPSYSEDEGHVVFNQVLTTENGNSIDLHLNINIEYIKEIFEDEDGLEGNELICNDGAIEIVFCRSHNIISEVDSDCTYLIVDATVFVEKLQSIYDLYA